MIDFDELERAADLLDSYADTIRRDGIARIEEHPYLPEVEELAETLRNAAPELIAMATRYQWLREHWARVVMTTSYAGANVPRSVEIIELGDHILGKVDPDTLDAAIDAAMEQKP